MPSRKQLIIILVTLITAISMVVVIVNLDDWFQDSDYNGGDAASTVYIDGEAYRPKNVTNYLLIGVDEFGDAHSSGTYYNTQQADLLVLLSVDHAAQSYSLLHINRDTMAEVTKLSVTGEAAGTERMQISLSHTYGDGMTLSGLNTTRSVSKLLYGLPIHYYLSMTMDGVAALNDQVGGVAVTVMQDMTAVHPEWVVGAEVTLMGEDALQYVRARTNLADNTNLSRMERQKQYMHAFMQKAAALPSEGGDDKAVQMYEAIAPYTVTNASVQALQDVFAIMQNYHYTSMQSLAGEAREGAQFVEYWPDAEALKALLKTQYYEKIENE